MKITGIKETCLYITDLERTRRFYQDSLGLELLSKVEGRHIFFRAGHSVLLCFIAEQSSQQKELPPHGAEGIIHFAFEVEHSEYQTAKMQVQHSGITIVYEQQWKNGCQSFYFNDPDNNLVEIVEEGLWE